MTSAIYRRQDWLVGCDGGLSVRLDGGGMDARTAAGDTLAIITRLGVMVQVLTVLEALVRHVHVQCCPRAGGTVVACVSSAL